MEEPIVEDILNCKMCKKEGLQESDFYRFNRSVCRECNRSRASYYYYRLKEKGKEASQGITEMECVSCQVKRPISDFYLSHIKRKECKLCHQAKLLKNLKKTVQQQPKQRVGRPVETMDLGHPNGVVKPNCRYCLVCQKMKDRKGEFLKMTLPNAQKNEILGGILRRICLGCMETLFYPLVVKSKNEIKESAV